jgi:hypothetical protein
VSKGILLPDYPFGKYEGGTKKHRKTTLSTCIETLYHLFASVKIREKTEMKENSKRREREKGQSQVAQIAGGLNGSTHTQLSPTFIENKS